MTFMLGLVGITLAAVASYKIFFGDGVMGIIMTEEEHREAFAKSVAELTCGLKGAIPEEEDYELADDIILVLREELGIKSLADRVRRGLCGKCRRTHLRTQGCYS